MKINTLFLFLALLAEILGTVGGFGSSVFFVPLGNFYFDFYSVLGLTAIFHLSSNLSKIFLFKKGLNKSLILYLGIPSVLFVVFGGILSNFLKTFLLELLLGIFLIGLSLLFLIKKELIISPTRIPSSEGLSQVFLQACWEQAGRSGALLWRLSIWRKAFLSLPQPSLTL